MRKTTLWLLAGLVTGLAHGVDVADLTGEEWYGLYMSGNKIGYAMANLSVTEDGTAILTEDSTFKFSMGGLSQRMGIFSQRTYAPDGALKHVKYRVDDPSGSSVFDAVVTKDKMVLTTTMGDQIQVQDLPVPKESIDDVLSLSRMVIEEPAIGSATESVRFEPMYKVEITSKSRIVGVEERIMDGTPTKVYTIKTKTDLMSLESTSYVAEDGTMLEDRVSGIMVMRLEPKEVAKDMSYVNDVIVSNAALVPEPIINARHRPWLRLHVDGPLRKEHLFNEERQTFSPREEGYLFEGKLLAESDIERTTLPITDEELQQWLKPSTFVQSDHPDLIAKAKEIVGDETDAFAASSLLQAWVYDNVRKTFSAQLTNSLHVLDQMQGDCTEHSMLFIGLARAAGLPAKEVAGLIYVDKNTSPGFYFHQWAKVWVGQWIDVDPTFDQPIADATHIKLSEGDLMEQTKLLPVIGQIEVRVAENQRRP